MRIEDLQLRFAYDHYLIKEVNPSGFFNVGLPNQFPFSKRQKCLLPNWSPLHKFNSFEDIVNEVGQELPVVWDDGLPESGHFLTHHVPIFWNTYYKKTEFLTVDECIGTNLPFIYPIDIHDRAFFQSIPFLLSDKVRAAVKRGQARICLFLISEGDPPRVSEFEWLDTFAIINELTYDTLSFYTGNIIARELYEDYTNSRGGTDRVNFQCLHEFENDPWFFEGTKSNIYDRGRHWQHIETQLHDNKTRKYSKYFLNYNRRPRQGRIWAYSLFRSNPTFDNKLTMSLGGIEEASNTLPEHLENDKIMVIKKAKEANMPQHVIDYLESLDMLADRSISDNLEVNLADNLNIGEHNEHFLSIISETWPDDNRTIFFSEKTFKPIYMCQPFIMIAGKGTLAKLRELGYKTFGDYWDESYDDIEDYFQRTLAIEKVLEDIASWPIEELTEIRRDMQEILEHNARLFMSLDRYHQVMFTLEPPKYV